MTEEQSDLVIFFADISGSTSLYERLGDVAAREQVSECIELMKGKVQQYEGKVIKTIGDEVMCTFPAAETAVKAAISMQENLSGDDHATRYVRAGLSVRIGFHYGPVLHETGDVFGDAVNLAARVAGMAKSAQIITTQSTIDLLPPAMRAGSRFVDNAPIRGKREEVSIFEVIWQQDNLTRMATSFVSAPKEIGRLALQHGAGEILMDPKTQPTMLLGRLPECGVVVDSDRASRQHARIEYRRGLYYLIDQSTNGTYIESSENEEPVFLRRAEMQLKGEGAISLGIQVDKGGEQVIQFRFEQ